MRPRRSSADGPAPPGPQLSRRSPRPGATHPAAPEEATVRSYPFIFCIISMHLCLSWDKRLQERLQRRLSGTFSTLCRNNWGRVLTKCTLRAPLVRFTTYFLRPVWGSLFLRGFTAAACEVKASSELHLWLLAVLGGLLSNRLHYLITKHMPQFFFISNMFCYILHASSVF